MAYKGVLDDIRACVAGRVPKRLPVFACSEEMDVRLCGRTYEEFATDAKVMAEVAIQSVKRLDYDWAWLQIDDCFVVENLGVGCKGEGNILRATVDYLPATRATLNQLPRVDIRRAGRVPILLEAIRRVKDEFGDTLCVVGHAEAPFSAATLLYGLNASMLLLADDPKLLRDTMRVMTEIEIEFALAQLEAGADAIWLGDCNASTHLMSVAKYQELAAEPCRQVIDAIQRAGGWTFLHNSEESAAGAAAQAALKPSALSIGPGGSLVEIRHAVGPKQCLLGNVNPILVLARGTPADVERQVREIIDTVSIHGGHILDSGEMVPRDTPEENIRTMIRVAREHWARRTRK